MEIRLDENLVSVEQFAVNDDVLKKIKKYTLRSIEPDDVHARAIRLTGDRLNSQLGRFRTKDLPKVMKLTHGANVTVGHSREAAPLGRFFDGRLDRENGDTYLVEAFYFPKDAEGDKIANRLDFGIYKEFSIAFQCTGLICSECGGDMRDYEQCIHFPGEASKKNEGESIFYWYDNVTHVLEGSIVLAGAHPGTGVARDFTALSDDPAFKPIFEKQSATAPLILDRLIQKVTHPNRPRQVILGQLAEASGLNISEVAKMVNGQRPLPNDIRRAAFASVFGVPLTTLDKEAYFDLQRINRPTQ